MDEQLRIAAFQWLEQQTAMEDVLSRTVLEQGFYHQGIRVTLIGPQGIWKPRDFKVPLSITTSPNSPYSDSVGPNNLIEYKYRGSDPNHRDNVGLREAMRHNIPLVYFHGLLPGKYVAIWPVYIVSDDPSLLSFYVAVDEKRTILGASQQNMQVSEIRRQYITSTVRTRLHQQTFRERVLDAYRHQCSFCQLKHAELLDAAHITPDQDVYGDPVITNGLSLCKIHHAAFDRYFIGVNPEYKIIVREDLLYEKDGPMLKHGIQALHNQIMILPGNKNQWPDKDRLEARFKLFRDAI